MADYIEREATVNLLQSLGSRDYRREKGTIQEAIKMVSCPEYTPSCDVEPVRHGRWINETDPDDNNNITTECSECHHSDVHAKNTAVPYCWFCGAKMDQEADNAPAD